VLLNKEADRTLSAQTP